MAVEQKSESTVFRTADFWRRAGGIYLGYKKAQVEAWFLRMRGDDTETVKEQHWRPQHDRAGRAMYELCVDMRGFFLKAGQFIGARSDFVPEEMCAWLRRLQDQVPPMPSAQVQELLKQELCVENLDDVFEWVELDKPLGSASIAQVHKAKLRQYEARPSRASVIARRLLGFPGHLLRGLFGGPREAATRRHVHVADAGDSAWAVANVHGIGLPALQRANAGNAAVDLHDLRQGDLVWLPESCRDGVPDTRAARRQLVIDAVRRHNRSGGAAGPGAGDPDVVAVKVQYPHALPLFIQDLGNLRGLADFLSRTELQFDLVSAVDELSSQVKLEFDFRREARVMDETALLLAPIKQRVVVPSSVPGLVTEKMLVMSFLDGVPLTQLESHTSGLSPLAQKTAFKRIISHASEAYGRMILETGLFQADGHPGNILVMRGGRVGLIDYGQSKQLSDPDRLQIARLILALNTRHPEQISDSLWDMGITTELHDPALRAEMGVGMFDTRGKVDPFCPDSPIKKCAIVEFPKQFFLVLRVIQLFRGLSSRMDIEFSTAEQWRPWAEEALRGENR